MAKVKNILHISMDFNYSCGVSKYVYTLLLYLSESKNYNVFFITNGGDSLQRLNNLSIQQKWINLHTGWKNIFFLFKDLNEIYAFCKRNKIEIIHTHHRYSELISWIISKFLRIKTISTVHSLLMGKNFLSFKSDKLISVSNAVKKVLLEEFRIPNNKIETMYNCLKPFENIIKPGSEIKSKLKLHEEAKIILYLGRLIKIKNINSLIKAFQIIHKKYSNVFLLIIGKKYDNKFELAGRNIGNIIIMPSVENPAEYYLVSDMVINPSIQEPFPYVMLESGLMKKPFIGSRTGGMAEFIDDGVNGLLFEPGNVDQLAEKIKYVLDNPDKSKLLGENLYKKVIDECSCDNYFRRLDEIYDELSR